MEKIGTMELYSHEEMLDDVLGVKGTPRRDKYESDMKTYTFEEAKDLHIGKRGTPEREDYEREVAKAKYNFEMAK